MKLPKILIGLSILSCMGCGSSSEDASLKNPVSRESSIVLNTETNQGKEGEFSVPLLFTFRDLKQGRTSSLKLKLPDQNQPISLSAPPDNALDDAPTWAPDKKTIVYRRTFLDPKTGFPEKFELRILQYDSPSAQWKESSILALPSYTHISEPHWSKDGKKIIYSYWQNQGGTLLFSNIQLAEIEGGKISQVVSFTTDENCYNQLPVFGGDDIVFYLSSCVSGKGDSSSKEKIQILKKKNPEDKPSVVLDSLPDKLGTEKIQSFSDLVLSPDETKISFANGYYLILNNIWVSDLKNSQTLSLHSYSNNRMKLFQPVWSEDGAKLFFLSNQGIKDESETISWNLWEFQVGVSDQNQKSPINPLTHFEGENASILLDYKAVRQSEGGGFILHLKEKDRHSFVWMDGKGEGMKEVWTLPLADTKVTLF